MGRPKGSIVNQNSPASKPYKSSVTAGKKKVASSIVKTKPRMTKIPLQAVPTVEEFKCTCCGKTYTDQVRNFYQSNSLSMIQNNARMTVCKDCIVRIFEFMANKFKNNYKLAMYFVCSIVDTYFDASLYPSVETQANALNTPIVRIYFQKVNSFPQYSGRTFVDSTLLDVKEEMGVNDPLTIPVDKKKGHKVNLSEEDEKNKADVIRMVGYDPFENDNHSDKKALYNRLVDFLDESTLEDSFKLPIVIEIVKSFNQIDKLNQALSGVLADPSSIATQAGNIKQLMETKDKAYRSMLAMAKDNGISVAHAMNKSQGAGTLSGIIKKLQELGFEDSNVNLYDIETCEGMKQVADISNKSILEQIILDENDYTQMIAEQRQMIENLDSENMRLKEELRLLKIKEKKFSSETVGD
jgi:hypothetical protein